MNFNEIRDAGKLMRKAYSGTPTELTGTRNKVVHKINAFYLVIVILDPSSAYGARTVMRLVTES
ncbi:MAG: hypothetical protein UY00_C0050G0009 [Candidatus Wolfebacteria bacterium GW2011_GWA1_47_6]|nr:MAG: hypothetical protein UY00_C0050G0009 [Candidatus Wolfebacteria bacterium GW2011_GWA1_47_6]